MWPYASVSASWAMFLSDSLPPRPPLSSGPNRRATNPSSSWAASRRSELRSGSPEIRPMNSSTDALAGERRTRLHAAMVGDGIDVLVVAGNAWRGDYLRFVAGVTVVEGQAFALIEREKPARLIIESAAEAARFRVEQPGLAVSCEPSPIEATENAIRALGAKRIALAPFAAVPYRLAR